jgi:hypothetical protein
MSEYLQECLRELRKKLKKIPRVERGRALRSYEYGVEVAFSENYPQRFPGPGSCLKDVYPKFWRAGYDAALQFGELEAEHARKTLLEAVERERNRKSLLERLKFWASKNTRQDS